MNLCGYCGRENETHAAACSECGTEFPSKPSTALPPKLPSVLDGRTATLMLVAFVAAQTVFAVMGALVGLGLAFAQGDLDYEDGLNRLVETITVPTALVSVVGGGAALVLLARRLFGRTLSNIGPTDAAWVAGPVKNVLKGLAAGILVGCFYFALTLVFKPDEDASLGAFARMANTPGFPRAVWMIIALLFAPWIEELLFRGIFYGGVCRSLGPVAASILTTGIFWLLHLTEMIHYWPSMIAIALFAVIALWCRVRFAAIGPAVAAHFGNNATLAVVLLVYG